MADRIAEMMTSLNRWEQEYRSELARAQAYFEVHRLLDGFMYLMEEKKPEAAVELFSNRGDATAEYADSGLFIGKKSILRLLKSEQLCCNKPGAFRQQTLTTPYIEVAGDGATAKGLWISNGHETLPLDDGTKGALWLFNRFGAEFIKEDGVWKIWKLQMFNVSVSEYSTQFTEGAPEWYKRSYGEPDAPTTFHQVYDKHGHMLYWPQLPPAYETWEGSLPMTGNPPEGTKLK